MGREQSRLAYMMDALGINGRELAKVLNVDYSLVSKWRTNNRKLTRRSAHIAKLAEYMISISSAKYGDPLNKILTGADGSALADSGKSLEDRLIAWLTDESIIEQSHKLFTLQPARNANRIVSECTTYRGNAERRAAVLQFLDYVISLPEGQKLMLISQEDTDWLTEDPEFFLTWQARMAEVLNRNNRITIIHWIDRRSDQLAAMLIKWLPLHLTGKIDSHYYPKYSEMLFRTTLFIIENHIAMVGMDDEHRGNNRYTAIFRDQISLQHYQGVFRKLIKACQPLVETCDGSSCRNLMSGLSDSFSGHQSLLLISDQFLFSTMEEENFERMLGRMELGSSDAEQLRDYYAKSAMLFSPMKKRYRCRHAYDLKSLYQAAAGEKWPFQYIPHIVEHKDIDIRDIFAGHLRSLIKALNENESFEMALVNFQQLPMILPANLIAEQANYVLTWSGDNRGIMVMSKEPTIVNSIYSFYDSAWESIPRVSRSKEFVISELMKMAEL